MSTGTLLFLTALVVPMIIAITFHEAAHGFAARALGDDTAAREGRLTLNPIAHIDPFGTLLLPAVLILTAGIAFGYAKPVPVNMNALRNPQRDMALVAAAGPLTNVALAVAFAVLLAATSGLADAYPLWRRTLEFSVVLNFVLAILNLYPLPPLDGSKVVAGFLPPHVAEKYMALEQYGFIILVVAILVVPYVTAQMGTYVDVGGYLLVGPAYFLSDGLLEIVGAN